MGSWLTLIYYPLHDLKYFMCTIIIFEKVLLLTYTPLSLHCFYTAVWFYCFPSVIYFFSASLTTSFPVSFAVRLARALGKNILSLWLVSHSVYFLSPTEASLVLPWPFKVVARRLGRENNGRAQGTLGRGREKGAPPFLLPIVQNSQFTSPSPRELLIEDFPLLWEDRGKEWEPPYMLDMFNVIKVLTWFLYFLHSSMSVWKIKNDKYNRLNCKGLQRTKNW